MQRLNTFSRLRPVLKLSHSRPFPKSFANMSAPSAAETDSQAQSVANTSGITTESLQRTITEKLEAKHVDIEDMSGKKHVAQRSSLVWFAGAEHSQVGVGRCFKP